MVELETINMLVQIVGISSAAIATVLGVSSYINSSKRAEEAKKKEQETRDRELETRQTQLFMQIYEQSQELEFMRNWNTVMSRDIRDVEAKWFSEGVWSDYAWTSLAKYFEGIGVLIKRGLLIPDLVYDYIPTIATSFWERYAPLTKRIREEKNWPQAARMIEYLATEM